MATVNLTTAASGNTPRGRKPYIIQNTIDLAVATTSKGTALASADVYQCLNIPAESVILHAGMEVTEILTGTSSDTGYDLGITGGDVDNFVDGFDADGAAAGDYAPTPVAYAPVMVGAADTLDILVAAQTGTTLTGKVRVFATLMDVSDVGDTSANEVDRDTLA
jgi:hypothetical protein|tara:strand:- start:124 stop:615 length:492 start_codon:yes stop_codon:yes gene_type:complete